jgi:two-component system, OmpR family, phosphate regulon sensor histidine kinase PhoR
LVKNSPSGSNSENQILSPSQVFATVVRSLPIGFSLVNEKGVIIEFNPAAEKITGYQKQEAVGRSHLEILHGSSEPKACPFFEHVFKKHEQSIGIEGALTRRDGRTIIVAITCAPLFDTSKTFLGGVEIFRDITELKRLERERRNLLSMFVHDLKHPLLVAHGFLSRLLTGKAGPLQEKQENYLKITVDEIDRLEHVVAEFLDFSQMEQGVRRLKRVSFDIREVIEKQIEGLRVAAERKKIILASAYPENPVSMAYGDKLKIETVVANLLDNAVKYTKVDGSIKVGLSETEKAILVEVTDTGIGIKEEELLHVFDVFYRADRSIEGTGLGLAEARRIVSAHGGVLSVRSKYGSGSTFWFTLPKP